MGYLPILTNPYPDEMLYSWLHRLAKVNGLNISLFGKLYLGQQGIYSGELPYDIKHEYVLLCQHLLGDIDYAGLYTKHSSLQFDALFHIQKYNYRVANSITLHVDDINTSFKRGFFEISVCPECINEDNEKYGEPYLHVSHNIGDTCFCKKHACHLIKYKGKSQKVFDFVTNLIGEGGIPAKQTTDFEYSCFVDDLHNSGITGSVEDLKRATMIKINEKGYSLRGNGFYSFETDYNHSKFYRFAPKNLRYCLTNYMIKKNTFECRNFIPILMFLFENVDELCKYVTESPPLLKNAVCSKCGSKFMSLVDERYSMGLCPDCYAQIPLQDRFNSIISISNNGTYETLSPFTSMNSRMNIRHDCGNVISVIPRNLIYAESKCSCENNYDEIWNSHYKLLKQYKVEYGTPNVPKRFDYKGFKLGQWCQKIRKDRANGTLPFEREADLIDIGFDFTPYDTSWERYFALYEGYVKETGICHVKRDVVYKGENIGNWYSNNRKKYLDGKMQQERIDKLRAVYPAFPEIPQKPPKEEVPRRKLVRFEDAVDLLLEYKNEHGTMNVRKSESYHGYKLGRWANQIRSKRRQGILPLEQCIKLNSIGFDWNPLGTKWKADIKRYADYVRDTSVKEVPKEATYNGFAIGYWYSNLKISRKNHSLSESQLADITAINPDFI